MYWYCWSKTERNKPEIIRPLSNLPYLLHLTPATVIRMKKIIKLSVTLQSLFTVCIFLSNVLCYNLNFCSLNTFTSLQCMAQFWDSTQEHAFAQNNLLSLRVFFFFQGGNTHLSLFLEIITCRPNLELHYPLKSNKEWKARLYRALNSKTPSKTFIHYT